MDLDNIQKPFIWRAKYAGQKIDEKQIEEEGRRKAEENLIELEKIRERQRKDKLEYQQKLNDGEFLQRQKEAEQHEHWEQQEDDFILKQHRHRSKIRIRDGRAKPIDLLAHYIDVFGAKPDDKKKDSAYLQEEKIDLSDSPVELLNPCDWFDGLRLADLEALEPDIKIYMTADCEENQQYWIDLLDIARNELSRLKSAKEQEDSGCSDINSAIITDVMSLFEGKTIHELDDLEEEMADTLRSDDPSVDVSFYQSALSKLRAYRAKIRLTLNHKNNLRRQKEKILATPSANKTTTEQSDGEKVENFTDLKDMKLEDNDKIAEDANPSQDKSEKYIQDYKEGRYSPKMYNINQLEPGIVCVDYEKEYEALVSQRNKVNRASSLVELAAMTNEERACLETAKKGMNTQEESTFSCEAVVKGSDNRTQTYSWADKYQPRKPRYFNRVHTGFEWNKYNQTHYDIDNPPPKVVQGYKFNIFYPDLIDKSKAPTFTLTPCKDDKDFCVIRFSAGPPYEDIAFRIVSREWNNSYKSGYRCQFINNMLQLWFQFKRYRYRR